MMTGPVIIVWTPMIFPWASSWIVLWSDDYADEDIAPPPEISKGGQRVYQGIGKAGDTVKLLLDCKRLLTADEVDALSELP